MTHFFSEDWLQEIIALGILGLSFLYILRRLTGWPKLRNTPSPSNVHLGPRLAQALKNRTNKNRFEV